MRSMRTIRGLIALAMPLLGAVVLLAQAGCFNDQNQAGFYTYCDGTGCYQCDATGCTAQAGGPPGGSCASSTDCAPGCYCASNSQCAEGGFCSVPTDCSSGFTCDVARNSCEPGNGGPTPPKTCAVQKDCGPGNECINAACAPVPLPVNPCVFDRECGTGGQCVDGLCEKACVDDTSCGTGQACLNQICVQAPPGMNSCVQNTACGASQTCIDSFCHIGCAQDSDCQAVNKNDICVANVCRANGDRVPECKMDSDCTGSSGVDCVNAQCRTFCFADSDCALCMGNDTVCQGGYCMTPAEANPQCRLASDCQGGTQDCVDAACTTLQ